MAPIPRTTKLNRLEEDVGEGAIELSTEHRVGSAKQSSPPLTGWPPHSGHQSSH